MTYAEFQEHFEQGAEHEHARFSAMPLPELLRQLHSGNLGEYYQIWRAVGERATPNDVNSFMLSFLESSADYLHRYHCAAALISLNGLYSHGWEAQHLSAEQKYPVARNLAEIRSLLRQG